MKFTYESVKHDVNAIIQEITETMKMKRDLQLEVLIKKI